VNNTSDASKPVSTAQQTALNLKADATAVSTALGLKADTTTVNAALAAKAPINNPTFTGTVGGVTAAMVGLGNVNNTADSAKPVSTAQQTALDGKPDVYLHNGSAYVKVTTGDIYVGPSSADPGSVGDGSVWIKTT
jgi:hypothetical protein